MVFVVAAIGDWNQRMFDSLCGRLPGQWHFAAEPSALENLLEREGLQPRYIFFPHWRWMVPDSILDRFECVCFHMTDVPFGRGGSPLQNLIARGHKTTRLTALKMCKQLDAGPVYLKRPLRLDGPAHAIYERTSALSWEMIEQIITENPTPMPQKGKSTEFRRRTPDQSLLADGKTLGQIYDHVRMLDAPGYPKAFIETEDYRIEFDSAELSESSVQASCRIVLKRNKA